MRFVRQKDRSSVRITGGIYLVPSEEDGGKPLALVYARPDARDLMRVAPDVQALSTRLRRYQVELGRYITAKDAVGDPPKLQITDTELQPVLDFIRPHLMSVKGLVDHVTGTALTLEDLEEKDIDSLLLEVGLDHLLGLYAAIEASDGLPGDLRVRLREYLDVMHVKGGCSCPGCEDADTARDETCLLWEILPHDDVLYLINEWHTHRDSDLLTAPGWLKEVAREVDHARAKRSRKEKDKEAQRALAEKHGLITPMRASHMRKGA